MQLRPGRHRRCERGRQRGEREAEHEQEEERSPEGEPDPQAEGNELALELQRRELQLQPDERARVLADLLHGLAETRLLSFWGVHVLSSRSTWRRRSLPR